MRSGKFRRVLVFVLLFLSCASNGFSKLPAYWCGETNVVLAVSAYERKRTLPNGDRIKIFSTEMDPLCTNYTAILFSVLHPAELKGKMIRLLNVPCELSSLDGFLPSIYKMDTLYYIPLETKREHGNVKALEQGDFFWMGNTNSEINVVSQEAVVYYWNEFDAQMRISELKEKEQRCSDEALAFDSYLRTHPRPLKEEKNYKEWVRINYRYQKHIHSDIPYYRAEQTNVLQQIERIRGIEK